MMQLNRRKVLAVTYGSIQAKSATMLGMGFCMSLSCGLSQQVYYKSPFISHLVHRHFGEGIGTYESILPDLMPGISDNTPRPALCHVEKLACKT
jgi:hypothetical protein